VINYNSNQPVYRSDCRVIGRVQHKVFHRTARASNHMLRNPKGWASDLDILEQVAEKGAITIDILDLETGKRYIAAIQDFWDYGVAINRMHGEQIVLPLKYWKIERTTKNSLPSRKLKKSNSHQMAFPF
jgi:hypothetical protein